MTPIEAYEQGYRKAMEDIQRDIAENMVLENIEFLSVDPKERTAEFANTLKAEDKNERQKTE